MVAAVVDRPSASRASNADTFCLLRPLPESTENPSLKEHYYGGLGKPAKMRSRIPLEKRLSVAGRSVQLDPCSFADPFAVHTSV